MTTVEKIRRINMNRVSPELYEAMVALSNAAAKDIDPDLAELIKIRASQMNHCAFCLDMHTADARKRGISEQKLTLLAAWEEAGDIFSEQEQAALAERELGQVIAMALAINAWNRIGVTTRLSPPHR